MTDMLQEFCDSRGVAMKVDRQAGVIRGVKVLGLESRNGRTYLPEALAQAARLYEDAKVNVNHPKGSPGGPRDYQDRIGTIRNVALQGGQGLFADFHFNPKHALAEQLLWDAEHSPENVGFSHNVEARTVRQGERLVVEAITRVQSVDLVADPATTRGLFEQQQAVELNRLQQEVERLGALEAVHQKRSLAARLLREFDLPDPEAADPWAKSISSPRFLESLLAAPDQGAMRELVEDRAQLVRMLAEGRPTRSSAEARPRSRDQHLVCAPDPLSAKSFVEAIT
jgi:hypothetical protein